MIIISADAAALSNTTNSTLLELENLYKETATTKAIKMSLYALVLFLSLVGNTLVCVVVCRQQRLRTSTNFFIVNLAIADLGITVFCIPFDVVVQETKTWPFGDFMCRILYPVMTMCAFASVGTLTAISLNRYLAILRPMRFRAGTTRAKWCIVAIWTISFLFVLPYMAILELSKEKQCIETWPEFYSKMYTIVIFVCQYVIPLTIITAAYTKIALQLRQNRMHLPASHRIQDRDVSKVVRMMTVVVTIFALCMLPNHILWLLRDFYKNWQRTIGRELLAWGEMLIYINSCTNPVVYSICIEEFRQAFKLYITKCCRVSQDDLKPITRMFERLSFRGRTASSTAILGRQYAKRTSIISVRERHNVLRRQSSGSVKNNKIVKETDPNMGNLSGVNEIVQKADVESLPSPREENMQTTV